MSCNLCGSNNTVLLFNTCNLHGRHMLDSKDIFKIARCVDCGNIFVDNIKVDDTYYKKYYCSDYYEQPAKLPKIVGCFLKLFSRISRHRKEKAIIKTLDVRKTKYKILDIGCGTGSFLLGLDPVKFEKFGVEISPTGQKICQEQGLNVFCGKLEGANFADQFFDAITAWHVFEHLEKPVKTLSAARRVLSDDGILVFQVPNADGFGFQYGQQKWFHSDSPRHLWLPNRKSIDFLLQKTGFKILEVKNEFYDYPLDLFWSVRKSKMRFLFYPFYFVAKILSKETLTFVCKKI
ncbi:MAG: class I SAM-dependent methyltransferase [Candidatus Falkowbacteria bacterium]